MLTRHGYVAIVGGVAALVIGRVFAVIELFVIGAGCFAACAIAVLYVRARRPRLDARRWVHPSVIVAGDTGRVDLHLDHRGAVRSAPFTLRETVERTMGGPRVARLSVDPMRRGEKNTTGYPLPSAIRGLITLGPLEVEVRDPLGIAVDVHVLAGVDEVVVAPRAHLLDIPHLGQGALGKALLEKARRLGPGEFHGLREYADGDEPRTIDWKASARTDSLMVKEHTTEGLQRCTVVFDAHPESYTSAEGFERGVTAAASIVHSAAVAGLSTRFVTTGGTDLRGPDVGSTTLRVLARIEPSADPHPSLEREAGDGLGIVAVVTGGPDSVVWHTAQTILDPTLTPLLISTEVDHASSAALPRLSVSAGSDDELVASWQRLAGRGRLDLVDR